MKKTLASLALALALLTVPAAAAFTDVDEGLYYAVPIAWAVEQGITTGTTPTTFSPDTLCTQGQILTFLWRAAGSPQVEIEASESASLNPDFAKAIRWAVDQGIYSGEAAIFPGSVLLAPTAPCTRGAAMYFLWRYAGSPAASAPGAFTDVAPEADYAQAVAWAVEQGITSGTSETTFSPNEPCTRGQIATFLYRCWNAPPAAIPAEEPPAAPAPSSEEEEKEVRPLRTLTGQGKAYSLGLDGSEFTSDGVYEATVTVEVYSSLEAVFTIQVPFPLFQACVYTARFEDPEVPGAGYIIRYSRWDEAFADIIPWEGKHNDYRLTDMSGTPLTTPFAITDTEDDRMGGTVSWRINLQGDPKFNFDRLDSLTLSCEVSCVP